MSWPRRAPLAAVAIAATIAAGCLEPDSDQAISIAVIDASGFYAYDGNNSRAVEIRFAAPTKPGQAITVTTTRGYLDVTKPAGDSARKTITVLTNSEPDDPVVLALYADNEPGIGELTAVAPDTELHASTTFELLPLSDALSIEVSPQPLIADGSSLAEITVSLLSENPHPRTVAITASRGVLAPPDATRTEVTLSPARAAVIDWQLGAEDGTAIITAELADSSADGARVSRTVSLTRADDALDLALAPGPYLADGASQIPIDITRQATISTDATVTLRTTHGVLNPAASDPAAQKQTTLALRGGETGTAVLNVGRTSGTALISASLPNRPPTALGFVLEYTPPTIIGLTLDDSPVFTAAHKRVEADVSLARAPGQGQVSLGTQVYFTTCCQDGGVLDSCDTYLTAPTFSEADSSGDQATATVRLTTAGEAFVNEIGAPPFDNLEAILFAYVFDAGFGGAPADCDELDAGTAFDIAASARIDLALQRLPSQSTPR